MRLNGVKLAAALFVIEIAHSKIHRRNAHIFKGPSRLYCLMVMTDIVLCLIFLLVQKTEEYNHTQGILLNILYCAWLLRLVTPRKRRSAPRPAGHTK